jgi:hypothetical protein
VSREAGIRHVCRGQPPTPRFLVWPLRSPRRSTSIGPSLARRRDNVKRPPVALRPRLSEVGPMPAAGWAFEVKWDSLRPLVSTEDWLEVCSRAAARTREQLGVGLTA